MKICIDPGHNDASEPGAVGPTGLKEADCTLAIAKLVAANLEKAGVAVLLTRAAEQNLSLRERCRKANEAAADYFVSIHINSAANPAATGTETYCFARGTTGEQLAQAIQAGLVAALQLPDRGVKTANFQVLRETVMPAVLTEVCFICNPAEEALLRQVSFQEKAAAGIAGGVCQYLAQIAPALDQWSADQATIQAHCQFDDPAGVWQAIKHHPYTAAVYQKWAASYRQDENNDYNKEEE